MPEITAKLKYLNISPRKVRLVADLIRNLPATKAIEQLQFNKKRSAKHLLKLLNSAIANARNQNLMLENLSISEIRVDPGPILKRWRARAMGRANLIRKRTSHITLVLNQKSKIKNQNDK